MSPILKREVAETVRQARRLAAAAGLGLGEYDEYEYELDQRGVSRNAESERERLHSPGYEHDRTHDRGTEWNEGRDHRSDRDGTPRDSLELAAEADAPLLAHSSAGGREPLAEGKLEDLRGLLFSSTPSLLFALIGLVFSGQLLEHCARWRVFRRVDELFILVPMIGNLKGNLEMCLSARLGTSATLGELDTHRVRRSLVLANMTLLGLQALLISCLAAVVSFFLGLITTHRLGDVPAGDGYPLANATMPGTVADPSVNDPWREGKTRPGGAQLVMVLATGMGAAGLSASILGSFMCSLVVMCRWFRVDPDNITPPVAACLGDLVTLFILALIGTVLVGFMDSPVPTVAVVLMAAAAIWFTRQVMRNEWVKDIARGCWIPLIGAMLISSGTGMILERGVGKYRGFALLAVSMTGLTGSIGAIHANRLSTQLHRGLHTKKGHGLSPIMSMGVLFALAFPCQGAFLVFVNATGWIDVSLAWAGWIAYLTTAMFSLCFAHFFTLFCWQRNLDPDSYTLPIQSAIVDFVGQSFLILAYEVCRIMGRDVLADKR